VKRVRAPAIVLTASWMAACAASRPPVASRATSESSDLPRRCRVHIDHVARTRVADFEAARRELLAAYAAKSVSEGATFVLETDEPAFLSLRPFEHYADLDAAGARQKTIDEAIGEATITRLDGITHATLVPPHHNEIWSLQSTLTYAPQGGPTMATAKAGRMVLDEVMPAQDDAYGEAVTREIHALVETRYPVTRAVYVSAYGSGRYVTLWLASSREDLEKRLPADAWNEEAKARSAATEQTEHTLVVRADLGSR
jgi:hypothetical protein